MNNIFNAKVKLNLETPEWNQVNFWGKKFESVQTKGLE